MKGRIGNLVLYKEPKQNIGSKIMERLFNAGTLNWRQQHLPQGAFRKAWGHVWSFWLLRWWFPRMLNVQECAEQF